MIIYIDASIAGISGNMMLGALLSLGAEEEVLYEVGRRVSKELGCKVKIKVRDVKGVAAKCVTVHAPEEGVAAKELQQALKSLNKEIDLSERAQRFSSGTLKTLLRAEEAVHSKAEDELYLHELGSADTLVDILGTAKLWEELGFFSENTRVYASHVLVGSGSVETSHGTLPVPAPVTAEILKGYRIPFKFSSVRGELATPTGAAILANLAQSYDYPPHPLKMESIGTGAGTFEFKVMPNILRIMVCRSELERETITTLETNIDDVSGEVLGYLLEKLYEEGALDVQIMPTITKKNRPGYMIFVLCNQGREDKLARILMEESGTLGVRVSTKQMRYASKREIGKVEVSLPGYKGYARVKVSFTGSVKHVKAEFDDAKKIARATGIPLKDVIKEIERQAKSLIS